MNYGTPFSYKLCEITDICLVHYSLYSLSWFSQPFTPFDEGRIKNILPIRLSAFQGDGVCPRSPYTSVCQTAPSVCARTYIYIINYRILFADLALCRNRILCPGPSRSRAPQKASRSELKLAANFRPEFCNTVKLPRFIIRMYKTYLRRYVQSSGGQRATRTSREKFKVLFPPRCFFLWTFRAIVNLDWRDFAAEPIYKRAWQSGWKKEKKNKNC